MRVPHQDHLPLSQPGLDLVCVRCGAVTKAIVTYEFMRRIQGGAGCSKHEKSLLNFEGDSVVSSLDRDHKALYQSLWDRVFCEAFPRSRANFHNAYDLYDYAAFRWNHDNETQSLMTSGELGRLRLLASTEQRLKHANLSNSGIPDSDKTYGIAGRTLAGKVANLFAQNIYSCGARNKLNLVFTSHEPFLAFFALAELSNGVSSDVFKQLPRHGATMTFELFSDGSHNETAYPSIDELHVRFLYRDSTDPGTLFKPYPIFGDSDSCMSVARFKTFMSDISIGDAATWCGVCESVSCFCDPPKKKNHTLLIILLTGGATLLIILILLILVL